MTIDKSGANTAALGTLNTHKPEEERVPISQSKYLNNLVEQDHRNIKRRIWLMLGFKSFRRAKMMLAGIELLNNRQRNFCQRHVTNVTEPHRLIQSKLSVAIQNPD